MVLILTSEGPERRNMKRLSEFRDEDANIVKEEKEVVEAVRADIEMLQKDGLRNIGEQYFDMLTSKRREIDRVEKELGPNNSHYKKLCEETVHWENVFNKTFNLSHYRRQLKPVDVKKREDMQATFYEKPWEEVINPLWKKAIEKGESTDEDDVKAGEDFGKRISPEGSEANKDYADPPSRNEAQIKSDKCNIL